MNKVGVAILGSGNIGTDLMIKVVRTSKRLELKALVGIDPHSDGLERARGLGIPTTHAGLDGLLAMPQFAEIKIVFDATSATAHRQHDAMLRTHGKQLVDLTPAALGPYTVPAVGARFDLDAPNINMVSCGGQATIPIVAAVSRVARVRYAEIVASISSRSAGAGTRANIDEFTKTTARGLEIVGGAERGKAIIVLNPAEPPLIMRNTVFTLTDEVDQARVNESIEAMVKEVQTYVPGYRLKQAVQFECFGSDRAVHIPGHGRFTGLKASVFLEVAGAAHYLPEYAGNLDIMTAAALAASERLAELKFSA